MNVIEVKNLNKEFKTRVKEKGFKGNIKNIFKPKYKVKKAVNNISFSVEKGEVVAFIGPNGAGKSTTTKMLTGILYPSSGDVSVMGINPVRERKKLSYEIGTVFGQKEQLWVHLTPYDNFKFFGAIYDIPAKVVEKKIEEFNEIFELQDFINIPVRNLSLGQRIRCEIVASLIHEPKILFLDEPTAALDPATTEEIHKLLLDLRKKGTTIFLTTHNMEEANELCDRVAFLNKGQIVELGSPSDLKLKYANDTVNILFEDEKNITIKKDADSIIQALKENSESKVKSIHSQEPNLAEIFLSLTGRELK